MSGQLSATDEWTNLPITKRSRGRPARSPPQPGNNQDRSSTKNRGPPKTPSKPSPPKTQGKKPVIHGKSITVISIDASQPRKVIQFPPESRLLKPGQSRPSKQRREQSKESKRTIPHAVHNQLRLRKKFNYEYQKLENGNVLNNSTIYVKTGVAHPHQIDASFNKALEKAREMFGRDFECDFRVNFIMTYNGSYLGYVFVDVSNPAFYNALIGLNVDGSERAEFIDDPTWVKPKVLTPEEEDDDFYAKPLVWSDDSSGATWDSQVDIQTSIEAPKIRRELPPLISLESYEYGSEQQKHLNTEETHGNFSISPAFVEPGIEERYDDCSLYVSDVPANDPDFLYALFSRYARTESPREKNIFFPQITIRQIDRQPEGDEAPKFFAIVAYAHHYDAAFALHMLQKIRAKYHDQEVVMSVRNAFKTKPKD